MLQLGSKGDAFVSNQPSSLMGNEPRDKVTACVCSRCANKMRYVSVETLGAVGRAATAWRWEVVRHRDSPQLAALKESTAEALVVLQGHLAQ